MAGLMMAMGIIGMVAQAVNIGVSGYNSYKQLPQIEQSIKDTKELSDKMQAEFQKVETGLQTEIVQFQKTLDENLSKISDLSNSIQVQKKISQASLRTIQIGGIILIVVVFFLLVMKRFGIAKSMQNILMAPFRKKQK